MLNEYQNNYLSSPEGNKKYWESQIMWLKDNFPNGEYRDIIGLCKVVKLEEEDGIIEQDYSLNVGRYVGVVIEEDGLTDEEYNAEMLKINEFLEELNIKTNKLHSEISLKIKEIFGEKL